VAPEPAGHALCVVMAAEGYPGRVETGDVVSGLDASMPEGWFVCHAGTAARDGLVVTSGGRVLSVGAVGASLVEARDKAYDAVARISFRGEHHRSDIGHRAL
jgi:phosphoribosylamine--glycine ligase